MAPRTRSNRAANLAKEEILAKGGTINTEGYLSLPAEIHLEILSHFPVMPVPAHEQEHDDLDEFNARHQTVSSLSQTCRALRLIFLGQLWKRIEVFDGMQTPKGFLPKASLRARLSGDCIRLRLYAEELIRQLEIVTIREPRFAQYVQIVNVVITGYSVYAVLDELAKAFAILPNLHTVQLNLRVSESVIADAFQDQCYPQIRTLSLTDFALFFANYCPEARVIVPYLSPYFNPYPPNTPKLEVLGAVSLSKQFNLSRFKNLRDISVVLEQPFFSLDSLLSLRRLQIIRLRIDKECGQWGFTNHVYTRRPAKIRAQCEVDKLIEYARSVLARTEGNKSSKKIIVTYQDGRVETCHI